MVEELDKKLIIDDELFFILGINNFIKEYKNENINSNDSTYFKRYYDLKVNIITYIIEKKKEYENKIIKTENDVSLLNKIFKELEIERNIKCDEIKLNINSYSYMEELDNITNSINKNKIKIMFENIKLSNLKKDYDKFNNESFEDKQEVRTLFKYIKREFLRERKLIISKINSNNLNEEELILIYEYLLLITKKMLSIQEDLINE